MSNRRSRPRAHLVNLQKLTRLFARGARRAPFGATTITATRDRAARLVCTTDIRVACASGTAWITTDSDIRDVVLETGEMHRASRGDRLFINGMPDCELHVEPVSPGGRRHHDDSGPIEPDVARPQ